jgi:phasin family protein
MAEPTSRIAADIFRQVMAIHLRNLEAFAKAQQALIEGNKPLLDQQLDTFKSMVEQIGKAAQEIASTTDPRSNLRKRFDAVKAAMQDGIGSTNIISEVSARSGAQAAQIIQDRTFEALDELQAVLEGMLDAGSAASGRRS